MEISTMMTTGHMEVEERNEKMETDYMKLKKLLYFKVMYCILDQMWSYINIYLHIYGFNYACSHLRPSQV